MRKVQLLILLAFLALFGAGAVSALVADRYVGHHGPPPGGGPDRRNSVLAERLGLTKDQHDQMGKIWSEARDKAQANWDSQRTLRSQRDEEIKAMLTPEQRKQLEAITAKFEAGQAKIRETNDGLFKQAEEKTREILTPDQRPKYEEFLKQAKERGDHGDHNGPRRGPGSRPSGMPPPGGPMGLMSGPMSGPPPGPPSTDH